MINRPTPPPRNPPPEVIEVQKLIINTAAADTEAAVRTNLEVSDYNQEREKVMLDLLKANVKGVQSDIEARKKYAFYIFCMVVAWLGAIIWIIIATGCGWYKISDTVMVALITSTTVNVASFFLAVTRYLFPSPQKDTQNDKG